jgi:hypothetical protein
MGCSRRRIEMDEKGFRAFVVEGRRVRKDLSEREIKSTIKLVKEFERSLSKRSPPRTFDRATKRDFEAFVKQLARTGRNTEESIIAFIRYARFSGNKSVELSGIQMLDGATVMESLSEILMDSVGPDEHGRIFRGITLPAIGSSMKTWPKVTKKLMDRLEANLDERTWKGALLSGPHTAPAEYYLPEKAKYEKTRDIDGFLKQRADEFIGLLTQHMTEGTLFFNQEIDENVLKFVRDNPEIAGGVRRGDVIYETKIPYMTREYLREKDKTKRRYLYCHCPWVREAIKTGLEVSANFCYCSAAFHKKPWDVIFGKPVEAEVVKSVLAGDLVCRFAIKIPKEHVGKRRSRR